jgi:XTP/dITP diphosphohydrolase
MKLYCATTNPGKLPEFISAVEHFAPGLLQLEVVPDMGGITPPEETGATFEENAVLKAVYYSAHAPGPVFCDDSGLEVDALGGAPGVHSARYAGPDATNERNNELLLRNLEGIEDRTARFVCVIALADQGRAAGTFRGAVEGLIMHEPRGPNGFGYDPLFFYPDFGCTFGEATHQQKLAVSHRGRALEKMCRFLRPS